MLIKKISNGYVRFFRGDLGTRSSSVIYKKHGHRRYVLRFTRRYNLFIDYRFVTQNVLTFLKESVAYDV